MDTDAQRLDVVAALAQAGLLLVRRKEMLRLTFRRPGFCCPLPNVYTRWPGWPKTLDSGHPLHRKITLPMLLCCPT
eukprot:scaffold266779_cov31-Tisochrysis_lutea.AAC.3